MRTVSEVLRMSPLVRQYDERLASARIPLEKREQAVHRMLGISPEMSSLKVSRKAAKMLEIASDNHVDTARTIVEAAKSAYEAGRRKIGVFSRSKTIFNSLDHKVRQQQHPFLH